jgi:hypothetical protein
MRFEILIRLVTVAILGLILYRLMNIEFIPGPIGPVGPMGPMGMTGTSGKN